MAFKSLSTLPSTVDEAYNDIMRRVENDKPARNKLALRTLSWIFHTSNAKDARPLRMEELCELLVTEEGDDDLQPPQLRSSPGDILDACRSLVIQDNDGGTLRFAHLTVDDYLQKCPLLKPISDLAMICLTYLSFVEFEKGRCTDCEALKERLEQYKAAGFIARFWGHFAREAEQSIKLQEGVMKLLSSEKKTNSMLQIRAISLEGLPDDEGWEKFQQALDGQTFLHVLAKMGLGGMLKQLLDGAITGDNEYVSLYVQQ